MTNPNGRFGIHGGQYIPETLMNAVIELEEAYNHFATACRMDPANAEYRAAFHRVQAGRQTGGYRTANTGGETCNTCDVCQALWCADCCCECMGGDCIRCC